MTKTAYTILSVLMASAPVFADGCKLHKFAEFPTTMVDMQPMMTANINGVDVQFLLDSGAFYSTMSAVSATQLKLSKTPLPFDLYVTGAHGTADVWVATAKAFTLPGFTLHNVEFLVGGSDVAAGGVGLLGQNFLHTQDVEYDLGQGTVRLMRAEDCVNALLAYWVSASTAYSVIELSEDPAPFVEDSAGSRIKRRALRLSPAYGRAYVNGTELRVLFDSGAGVSTLSLKAAARAGIKTDSPGVVAAGMSHGIGKDLFATYIAPVASFKIGNEEIKNTRLRIGDLSDTDMLLGADFFLSHRIYVANSQHKVYFTYNGGPVFNLTAGKRPVSATAADTATPAPAAAAAAGEDAADLARRGAAFASRREFEQALAALTRACELAPDNPEYHYRRGMVYWQMEQPDPAMADFDRALKLKPGDVQVLISWAQLSIEKGGNAAARADLDAADASAPKEADLRYQMGTAYQNAGRLASATTQFTLWIEAHADDARVPEALNSRCWVRALAGTDLPLALADCNAALRRAPRSSALYASVADSRGLVFLRLGNYDKSIADYDASLKIDTENAWSLYGRGIDRLRKNETSAGKADIAKATAVWPEVAKEFDRRGIVP